MFMRKHICLSAHCEEKKGIKIVQSIGSEEGGNCVC